MERINLVDLDFNSFTTDEKRGSFITMDMMMKRMHEKNQYVTSFMPQDIYYDRDSALFVFDSYTTDSKYIADSREEAIKKNIIELSTLAFCSYLKTYDPKDGLLNNGVIATEFNNFVSIFDPDDAEYYKKVLVDAYQTGNIDEPIYYSDAAIAKARERKTKDESTGLSDNRVLSYATQAGKAMAENEREAAFGTQFFLVSMVACFIIAVIGFILYFINM